MKVIHVDFTGDQDLPQRSSSPEDALLEAKKWATRVDVAREGYHLAIADCRRLGLSNVAIARAVGKTEAAVRMHFNRRAQ